MLSKSFFIVLLGCASALASPIQGYQSQPPQDLGSFLQGVHDEIRTNFKQTVKPFVKSYNYLVRENSYTKEYSKKKQIDDLRKNFHEITDRIRENLSDLENKVLANLIVNLQRAVEFLSKKSSGAGIGYVNPTRVVITDKFGGGVHDNDEFNELALNPQGNGNEYSITELKRNIIQELAIASERQMSDIKQKLTTWRNQVDNFLTETRGINTPGSIGYVPSIDEDSSENRK